MPIDLDEPTATRFARVALANVAQEYPNHPGHLLNGPADAATPRVLHPAFYGSYDWHSCVHMHWLLVRVRTLHPGAPTAPAIARLLDAHLTSAAIAVEAGYFERSGTQSFERTYGWAWLLALAAELERAGACDPAARRWRATLAPLVDTIVARFVDYLPRAAYAIRYGTHPNSAFGLLLALDHATTGGATILAELVRSTARGWFAADRDLPAHWEPSGADFLSPALVEAHLMARVLDAPAYPAWLDAALPGLATGRPASLFEPVAVSDRSDPQIVHLDGLNLSRAWSLRAIARALPAGDARVPTLHAAAERHLCAGLAGVDSGEYVGAHWLATFAVLAMTG